MNTPQDALHIEITHIHVQKNWTNVSVEYIDSLHKGKSQSIKKSMSDDVVNFSFQR